MQYKVQTGLSWRALASSVPRRFRRNLPPEEPCNRTYALLLFRCSREDVVLSRVVKSALTKLAEGSGEKIVAVAGCFTADSVQLLQQRGAVVLQLCEFHWTDESYDSIRRR